jgi:hypothetical protein
MTTNLPDLPVPAGAIRVYEWADVNSGTPSRYFVCGSWTVDRDGGRDLTVSVDGIQRGDGATSREIVLLDGDTEALLNPLLTAAQARQLAGALIAAADALDELLS